MLTGGRGGSRPPRPRPLRPGPPHPQRAPARRPRPRAGGGGPAGAGAAAAAGVGAGGCEAAGRLLGRAGAGPLDEPQGARAVLLGARLPFGANRGSDAPPLLLKAARRLEPIDAGLARGTYLDALTAALFAGRLASPGGSSREVSEAARAAPRPSHPLRPPDLLLDGVAVYFTEG